MSQAKPQISFFYGILRVIADWLFSIFHDLETTAVGNVPLRGSLILAANHVSYYDPPVIGIHIHRQIHYFARDTLFKGLFGKALLAIGTIPVARDNADIRSLKAIFKSLKNKGAIAIYPEGTRSHDGRLAPPKSGIGMIACKSGATVVPTRLFGTYEAYGRQRKFPELGCPIHIIYGKPMTTDEIDPGKDHPERYLEASRRIMARIAELKPPVTPVI